MPIDATIKALTMMNKKYCRPSQLDYSQLEKVPEQVIKNLKEEKYFERLFAYEFYHQFRCLIESGDVNFGGAILHAEVPKEYQRCFEKSQGKIPDFILHVPSAGRNLCVIEFKRATNLGKIDLDLDKLLDFRRNEALRYDYIMEVVIGNDAQLSRAIELIQSKKKVDGEIINIVYFLNVARNLSQLLSYVIR
jgi:hypothetical protein